MKIVDFHRDLADQAQALLKENLLEEGAWVKALPGEAAHPPLEGLADNGLGVAVVEDDRLLGFLGAYGPWKPVFCTPDTAGVFSPLHAHAVRKENRIRIWQRMYQAAAEKWAAAGAASHAITLYAHDAGAREALYLYGFGVRCMDLMRPMTPIESEGNWACRELAREEQPRLTPLRRALAAHLEQSPCFMQQNPELLEHWLRAKEEADTRVFAAERNGRIIAYMEAGREGENHVSCVPGTMNICGAYCLPEYRGTGAAQSVLSQMISTFRSEGYIRLGVDCESFNPTALGFWRKYFDVYTHSVVRRIDENILR